MLDFIRDFLQFVDKHGIYDQYDKDTNKMVTSSGVEKLIKQARACMPEELKPLEAANAMRDLSDDHRDALIKAAGPRVVDLRTQFAQKMSANGGAIGLLEKLVAETDTTKVGELLEDARTLVNADIVFAEAD